MNASILLALLFAALLGLEWRYQLRRLRLGAVLLALVVLFFAQPSSTRAVRRAFVTPPAERVTELGTSLSEYESGVATMKQAVDEDSEVGAIARLLGIGALFWLAFSPVLRNTPRPPSADVRRDDGNSHEVGS